MKRLTVEQLEAASACPDAIEQFKRTFGVACEVTEENVKKFAEFDLTFAHQELLTNKQQASIKTDYRKLKEEYHKKYDAILEKCIAAGGKNGCICDDLGRQKVSDEYNLSRAKLLVRAYNLPESSESE
jgi:hypothetical protein